jgi:hypothetical protein
MSPASCSVPATTLTVGRCTEHHGQELMAQREVLLMHPVVGHQQPASATLLYLMHDVARG